MDQARFAVLARAMFERRCVLDEADPEEVERAWGDPDIRAFWEAEAVFVLTVLEQQEMAA